MKLIITELEASAEELRQSNSLADAFSNLLRRIGNGKIVEETDEEDLERED